MEKTGEYETCPCLNLSLSSGLYLIAFFDYPPPTSVMGIVKKTLVKAVGEKNSMGEICKLREERVNKMIDIGIKINW